VQAANLVDKHLPSLDASCPGLALVGLEGARKGALELERDALAHHPLGVDRVDQRLGVGLQQISAGEFDHGHLGG